jgi:hypothetical protein
MRRRRVGKVALDLSSVSDENRNMSTATSSDALADLDALLKNLGHRQDPDLVRRVENRADEIRERVFREKGVLDVAVELVRETRNE